MSTYPCQIPRKGQRDLENGDARAPRAKCIISARTCFEGRRLTFASLLMCRYGDFGQMFDRMLRDTPEEQWDIFYPVDNNWPTVERLASYEVPI